MSSTHKNKPRILLLDIETSPLLGYVWSLWNNNVGLNQLKEDWHLLSWSAKWLGEKEIFYMDQRGRRNIEDDKRLCNGIWKLMDKADIILTQNGKKFDIKKLNSRFLYWHMPPPSSYRQIDTCEIAKKKFGFTSNKLEYMADKFTGSKKMTKREFAGFELWSECLKGNIRAWKEMEKYNKMDVVVLEKLYGRLKQWDNTIQFNTYSDKFDNVCNCGSTSFVRNGFYYTNRGKYQRFKCTECNTETHDATNLLSSADRKNVRKRIV